MIYDVDEREEYEDERVIEIYLAPRDVMYSLGIGRSTLYRLLNSGELKGFRIGRQWRVTREALSQFADKALRHGSG